MPVEGIQEGARERVAGGTSSPHLPWSISLRGSGVGCQLYMMLAADSPSVRVAVP